MGVGLIDHQKYPSDYTPQQVRERERNAVAMEIYLNKLKEYSKDSRNSALAPPSLPHF
jgi:hypothetical protein